MRTKTNELLGLMPVIFTTAALLCVNQLGFPSIQVIFFISLFLLILSRKSNGETAQNTGYLALGVFGLATAAFFILTAIKAIFGEYTIGSFLYHLKLGLAEYDFTAAMGIAPLFGIVWLFTMLSVTGYYRRGRYGKPAIWALTFIYVLANPITPYGIGFARHHLGLSRETARPELVQEYIRTELGKPAPKRKNLIIIYLEGLERTFQDESVFGKAYRPLGELEALGVTFTDVGQVSNTEWTIAGMVASQCGVPLVTPGIFSSLSIYDKNSYLPNTICLGDLLSSQGYTQEFLLGSSSGFARKDLYYKTHGFDELVGRQQLVTIAPDDRNAWGLYDDDLLAVAKTRLTEFEASRTPYQMVLLTLGPHGHTAFVAKPCLNDTHGSVSDNILEAVACTGGLTRVFLRFVQETVDMDNTLIVLLSDHLSHENNMTPVLDTLERRNTVMMFGAGLTPRRIDKPGAMIDIFPTILDAMGYDLPDHQAGLGVSLLSERATLVERFGINGVNSSLLYDTALAKILWAEE